ncbi:MAG: hypothetical protein AB7T49_18480 [Oligoflexales bacterium]
MKNIFKLKTLIATCFMFVSCGREAEFVDNKVPVKELTPEEQADLERSIAKDFTAGKINDQKIDFDTGFNAITQKLTFTTGLPTEEMFFQTTRTPVKDAFVQGHVGTSLTENFAVKERGLLDIIIVMDNSHSMSSMQAKTASQIAGLLAEIRNTNWQIGVVTTESSRLRSAKTSAGMTINYVTKKFYDENTVDAMTAFSDMLNAGTSGHTVEQGIFMARKALDGECWYLDRNTPDGKQVRCDADDATWLRPEANKAVIIISDERNCGSIGTGDPNPCAGRPGETADYLLDGLPLTTVIHGLLFLKNDGEAAEDYRTDTRFICDPDKTGSNGQQRPVEYEKAIAAHGGVVEYICNADYTSMLRKISSNINAHIRKQYELTYTPDPGSLVVKVDGVATTDFEVRGNILELKSVSDGSTNLDVNYKHGAVPVEKTFDLSTRPASETLQVTINGSPASPMSFKLFGQKVQFNDYPPEKATIEVSYRKDEPLIDKVTTSSQFADHTIKISVADKPFSDYTADGSTRLVQFTKVPKDGDAIVIRYLKPSDLQTRYPVNVDHTKIEGVTVVDDVSGGDISAVIEGTEIVFPMEAVVNDRKVSVSYDMQHLGDELKFSVPLAVPVLDEKVDVFADGGQSRCQNIIELTSEKIGIQCEDDDVKLLSVEYQYVTEYTNTFTMEGEFLDRKVWTVFVNDKLYENYTRTENTITIPEEDLPLGARVRILVEPAPENIRE